MPPQVAFRSLHRSYSAAASTEIPEDMDRPLAFFWEVVQAKFPELAGSQVGGGGAAAGRRGLAEVQRWRRCSAGC
jgi:hypothetical protein